MIADDTTNIFCMSDFWAGYMYEHKRMPDIYRSSRSTCDRLSFFAEKIQIVFGRVCAFSIVQLCISVAWHFPTFSDG